MKKILTLLMMTLAVLAAVVSGPIRPASAGSPAEQDYLGRINALRASHGAGPLTLDANLTDLAREHTQWMVDVQKLQHTTNLPAGVTTSWQKLGENIGFGSNIDLVWTAFLNSPPHLENLLDPAFDSVGVGVVVDGNGISWTTHRFMQTAPHVPPPLPTPQPYVPATPATAPPTQPPATPAPQPRPAPRVTVAAPRPVPVFVAPTTTTPPAPPVPVMVPGPADPERVASVLDALHASG